ncbi:alpha/beta fold hydrolase [Deinococcus sp. UYEF24]
MTEPAYLAALHGLTRPRRRTPAEPPILAGKTPERLVLPFEGEELTVWRWGDSDRRALFVHGWEDDSALWQNWTGPSLAQGIEVLSLDLPAHGHSTAQSTTVVQSGRAVAAVAAQLGPVIQAVGHSMGSAALLSAFNLGLRVRRSVHIAGPSVLTNMVQGTAQSAGLNPEDTILFVAEFERLIGGPTSDWDVQALAAGLSHPGLIAHDPDDRRVPFSEAAALHAHWPGSELLSLPGTGHRRIVESELLRRRALESFLW